MKNKLALYIGSVVVLVGIFIIATVMFKNKQKEQLSFLAQNDSAIFVRDYSPRFGNKNARIFLTEFLDPECESCRVFYPKVKSLLAEFADKVQLVVRYAPFHRNSKHAVQVLEATRKQNKYWESIELLFKYQPYWADHHNPKPELVYEYLPQVGVDIDKLKQDMQSPEILKIIEQDIKDLRALNVRQTPSFFVNGRPLEYFGIDHLRDLIIEEIKKQYP